MSSLQFPVKEVEVPLDKTLCTLLYTYPLTNKIRAVKGAIGVKFYEAAKIRKQMVQNGYINNCFHTPYYIPSHQKYEMI